MRTGPPRFEFLHLQPLEDLLIRQWAFLMGTRKTFLPSPLAARMRALTSASIVRPARFPFFVGEASRSCKDPSNASAAWRLENRFATRRAT